MEIKAIIVDDELNNQKMLEKMLSKTPYKIKVMGRAFFNSRGQCFDRRL